MTKSITIKLPKGQYISDIEPFKSHGIPNNSIIWKPTGSGITHFAIMYFKHHCIIILPNVPVIIGKVQEHNRNNPSSMQILGVHKGVDVDDIKEYLLGEAEYKKILTTPEGFITKVMKAFADEKEVMYNNYFLLYDECERIITDVSYRGAIAAPMDELFNFRSKALVSATTLPYTDERLIDFNHYTIEPTYDYSKPLKVIATNNVISSLKHHIEQLNSSNVCIFINSTNGISAIVKKLEIETQSKAYCSQESVVKLMTKGYKHASSDFDHREMKPVSLFTSRYFSAMDIKLDYKPDVIMVSDVLFADHSILDPHTEIIQIAGRFRNGVNSITHITNFNPNLESKSEEETRHYLQGCFDTYNWFVRSHESATHKGSKDMFKSAIDASPVNSFFNNGQLNTFMLDNAIQEERVKGYYRNAENLKAAYGSIQKHFTTTFENESFPISDEDFYKLYSRQTKKERYRIVAELINQWTSTIDHYVFADIGIPNKLCTDYPKIAEGHYWLGLQGLEATDFVPSKIAKKVKEAKAIAEIKQMAPMVYEVFTENTAYPESYIMEELTRIYYANRISRSPHASYILKFFNGRRTTRQGVNVYELGDRRVLSN